MKRPNESDYTSQVAYTRALEEYCDTLAQPAPVQKPTDIAAIVEGMEVSIDVSAGEHDASHRLFGTVTLAQENQGSKHGLILLVQEPTPNFKVSPVQEPDCKETGVCVQTGLACFGQAAQPAQGPVIGTKTWFEDGKIVTQNLYHSDIYTTPPAASKE